MEQLSRVDPSNLKHEEKLAFWINLYNALLMHVRFTLARWEVCKITMVQPGKAGIIFLYACFVKFQGIPSPHSFLGVRLQSLVHIFKVKLNTELPKCCRHIWHMVFQGVISSSSLCFRRYDFVVSLLCNSGAL